MNVQNLKYKIPFYIYRRLLFATIIANFVMASSSFASAVTKCEIFFSASPTTALTSSIIPEAMRAQSSDAARLDQLRERSSLLVDSQEAKQEALFHRFNKQLREEDILTHDQLPIFSARKLRQKVRTANLIIPHLQTALMIFNESRKVSNKKLFTDFAQFDNFTADEQIKLTLILFELIDSEFSKNNQSLLGKPKDSLFSYSRNLGDSKRKLRKDFSDWWADLMELDPGVGFLYLVSELQTLAEEIRTQDSGLKRITSALRFHFAGKYDPNKLPFEFTKDHKIVGQSLNLRSPSYFLLIDLTSDETHKQSLLRLRTNGFYTAPVRFKQRLNLDSIEDSYRDERNRIETQLNRLTSELTARREELQHFRSQLDIPGDIGAKAERLLAQIASVDIKQLTETEVTLRQVFSKLSPQIHTLENPQDADPAEHLSFTETFQIISAVFVKLQELRTEWLGASITVNSRNHNYYQNHITSVVDRLRSVMTSVRIHPDHFENIHKWIQTLSYRQDSVNWRTLIASDQEIDRERIALSASKDQKDQDTPQELLELVAEIERLESEKVKLRSQLGLPSEGLSENYLSAEVYANIHRLQASNLFDLHWPWLNYTSKGNQGRVHLTIVKASEMIPFENVEEKSNPDNFDVEELYEDILPLWDKVAVQTSRAIDQSFIPLTELLHRLKPNGPEQLSYSELAEIEDHRSHLKDYLREVNHLSQALDRFIQIVELRQQTINSYKAKYIEGDDFQGRLKTSILETEMKLESTLQRSKELLQFLIQRYDTYSGIRTSLLDLRLQPTESLIESLLSEIRR